MSLQSVQEFTQKITSNPALLAEVSKIASGNSPDDAANAIAAVGKREGYDFTPAEAKETRQAYVRQLSDSELDSVAGAGDPAIDAAVIGGATIIGSQVLPAGTGGAIGAGVGTGIAIAIDGGSASDAVAGGAMAAAEKTEETKSIVQQIFSGW